MWVFVCLLFRDKERESVNTVGDRAHICVRERERSRRWACPVKTVAQLGKKREWVEEQCSELQCAIIIRGMKLQGWYLWDPRVWCADSPGAHLGPPSHSPLWPAIINNLRGNISTPRVNIRSQISARWRRIFLAVLGVPASQLTERCMNSVELMSSTPRETTWW